MVIKNYALLDSINEDKYLQIQEVCEMFRRIAFKDVIYVLGTHITRPFSNQAYLGECLLTLVSCLILASLFYGSSLLNVYTVDKSVKILKYESAFVIRMPVHYILITLMAS